MAEGLTTLADTGDGTGVDALEGDCNMELEGVIDLEGEIDLEGAPVGEGSVPCKLTAFGVLVGLTWLFSVLI